MGFKMMEICRAIYDPGYGERIIHIGGAQTGDYSHFIPWVALAAISLGGIILEVILLRNSKNKKEKKNKDDEKQRK